MSISPANILQRLQELRNWQHNQQNFVKSPIIPTNEQTRLSDYETIDGISEFDTSLDQNDIDSKPITPQKSFEQLLEEKLRENGAGNVERQLVAVNRPKRPFLRKGSGLRRFRMTPDDVGQPTRHVRNRKRVKNTVDVKTPLRPPDFALKPKGSWTTVVESQQISDLASPNEQSSYERVIEKELQIFEVLEQKVENGSFCSTNSSILRIFQATPQKSPKTTHDNSEKRVRWHNETIIDEKPQINPNIDIKKLLEHLKQQNSGENAEKSAQASPINFDYDQIKRQNYAIINEKPQINPNIDINKLLERLNYRNSCENTEKSIQATSIESDDDQTNCSSDISISSTDLETTLENPTYDRGVNTDNLLEITENSDLKRANKTLQHRIDELTTRFDCERKRLLLEIENERQKLLKLRNTTSLKDRELIKCLKQELLDLKETMKLKETKNGTTQARLRNQIKQMEKENRGLKDEIDRLLKENAKLQAIQKLKQNNGNKTKTETKILKEINENVNKLIENGRKSENDRKDNDKSSDSLDFTNFKITDCDRIEKQYETTFKEKIITNNTLNDSGKTERSETVLTDGSREIKYPNGNLKIISPDGNTIIMKYYNGDIKQTSLIDGIIKYYYNDNKIWQITYSDGTESIEYPEGHKEKRYPDGKCEILFPDGMLQTIHNGGGQEIKYPDGSVLTIQKNGDKILNLPNGQKEIQTKEHKRREYPDGTIKIIYNDGIQETRYSNGRIRKKDNDGRLIYDNFAIN